MADKNVNIKFTADSKGAEKGINKVTSDLNKLSKKVKGTDLAKLGVAAGAVGIAFKTLSVAISKTIATVKDLSDTYRVQQKAEVQLEAAAKNNPYLNKDNVKQLKAFASEMQKISTHGDEELLPMMAKLAAAGRTQEEIQKIIATALDVEASGMMSLDSAVSALNGTLEGNAGALGKQVKGLKDLSAEELKAGKGIELISGKFKGLSEEVTKQTGSTEQLKNAWGDFKEVIGKGIEDKLRPIRQSLTSFITWATNALNAVKTPARASTNEEKRNYLSSMIADDKKELAELMSLSKKYTTDYQRIAELQKRIAVNTAELGKIDQQEKTTQNRLEAEKQALEVKNEEVNTSKTLAQIQKENDEALNKRLSDMEREANLKGETVSKQSVLNEMIKSYVDLLENGVDENDPFAEAKRKEIQEYVEWMQKLGETTGESASAFDNLRNALSDLSSYFNEYQNLVQDASELFLQSAKEESDAEMGELAQQYNDGLISYEEYCDKKNEIEKKAAQEQYKIKMWEWSANLMTATANIAQGVTKALADNGMPMGAIMAALVSASGAIQLASLIANKPKPPAFAGGGIVGATMGGDNTIATVRSGEMVLNAMQQKQLWSMANGRDGMGINMPVTINNTASDKVNASAQMTNKGLVVVINDIVNSQMQSGAYTQSMNIANSKSRGASYL